MFWGQDWKKISSASIVKSPLYPTKLFPPDYFDAADSAFKKIYYETPCKMGPKIAYEILQLFIDFFLGLTLKFSIIFLSQVDYFPRTTLMQLIVRSRKSSCYKSLPLTTILPPFPVQLRPGDGTVRLSLR